MTLVIDQQFDAGGSLVYQFGDTKWLSQAITIGAGIDNIARVIFNLAYNEGTQADISVDIYAADGSQQPTGSSLGTSTISGISNTSLEEKIFDFSPIIDVNAESQYCMVITSTGQSSTAGYELNFATSSYAGGLLSYSDNSGSSWSNTSNWNADFLEYYELPSTFKPITTIF